MEPELPSLFNLRPMLPDAGMHKGTRDCEFDECRKSTREGKPFCSRHINESPYIQDILKKLDGAAEEEAILEAGRRPLDQDGFFVREAVLLLRTRDFTTKSFSRRLDISHKAAERLIDLLVRWDLAARVRSSRGAITITGLGPRDLIDGI